MSFTDAVALVAGAGGGMGLNIANDLISAGARVVLVDVKPEPEGIKRAPGEGVYHQCDLTDEPRVADIFRDMMERYGRLDYLVNTVGVLWFDRDKSLLDTELEIWDQVFNINLKSFVITSRLAIHEMKRSGGGAMVHFSSIDALVGDAVPQDAYGALKAAVIRLSKSIAIQFAADGIRSNTVLPGPVMSPMQQRWHGHDDLLAQVAQSIPLGRVGTTQDLSNACLFLLSDSASFITGTELIVDGGITAK